MPNLAARVGGPIPDALIKEVHAGVRKSVLPLILGTHAKAAMPRSEAVSGGVAGAQITFDFPNTPSLPTSLRRSVETAASSWGPPDVSTIEHSDGTSCIRLTIDVSKLAQSWNKRRGGVSVLLFIFLVVVVVAILVLPPETHVSWASKVHPSLGAFVKTITKYATTEKAYTQETA